MTMFDGRLASLDDEDIRPVLMKLSCTARVTPQDFKLVVSEVGQDL